jgi:hypothetical protein
MRTLSCTSRWFSPAACSSCGCVSASSPKQALPLLSRQHSLPVPPAHGFRRLRCAGAEGSSRELLQKCRHCRPLQSSPQQQQCTAVAYMHCSSPPRSRGRRCGGSICSEGRSSRCVREGPGDECRRLHCRGRCRQLPRAPCTCLLFLVQVFRRSAAHRRRRCSLPPRSSLSMHGVPRPRATPCEQASGLRPNKATGFDPFNVGGQLAGPGIWTPNTTYFAK